MTNYLWRIRIEWGDGHPNTYYGPFDGPAALAWLQTQMQKEQPLIRAVYIDVKPV